jgi:hypothetical protein
VAPILQSSAHAGGDPERRDLLLGRTDRGDGTPALGAPGSACRVYRRTGTGRSPACRRYASPLPGYSRIGVRYPCHRVPFSDSSSSRYAWRRCVRVSLVTAASITAARSAFVSLQELQLVPELLACCELHFVPLRSERLRPRSRGFESVVLLRPDGVQGWAPAEGKKPGCLLAESVRAAPFIAPGASSRDVPDARADPANAYRSRYDVSADEERFLVNTAPAYVRSPAFHVVMDWRAPLPRREN